LDHGDPQVDVDTGEHVGFRIPTILEQLGNDLRIPDIVLVGELSSISLLFLTCMGLTSTT
jgi:hypothetical protein